MSRSRRASREVISAESEMEGVRQGLFHKRSTGVINPLLIKELGKVALLVNVAGRTTMSAASCLCQMFPFHNSAIPLPPPPTHTR